MLQTLVSVDLPAANPRAKRALLRGLKRGRANEVNRLRLWLSRIGVMSKVYDIGFKVHSTQWREMLGGIPHWGTARSSAR